MTDWEGWGGLGGAVDGAGWETRVYAGEGGLWVAVRPVGVGDDPLAALLDDVLGEGTALLLPVGSPLRLTVGELGHLAEATADVLRGQLEERARRRSVRCGASSATAGRRDPRA